MFRGQAVVYGEDGGLQLVGQQANEVARHGRVKSIATAMKVQEGFGTVRTVWSEPVSTGFLGRTGVDLDGQVRLCNRVQTVEVSAAFSHAWQAEGVVELLAIKQGGDFKRHRPAAHQGPGDGAAGQYIYGGGPEGEGASAAMRPGSLQYGFGHKRARLK